jgi:hypothetical protein
LNIKQQKIIWHFFVTAFVFIVILSNCGYSINKQTSLPFTEIHIGLIENKTFEPKLQDLLHRALTEEFLRQGISINPNAKHKLTGVINTFNIASFSEKDEITIEYRVFLNADFKLYDEKNDIREIKNISSPFIISFTGSEDFSLLLTNRTAAEEEALRDVAMQIAGYLIYR